MLGLLLGLGLAALCDSDDSNPDYDDDFTDEWLKPNTHAWRNIHPYGYNQYTGGWNEDEDEENGW